MRKRRVREHSAHHSALWRGGPHRVQANVYRSFDQPALSAAASRYVTLKHVFAVQRIVYFLCFCDFFFCSIIGRPVDDLRLVASTAALHEKHLSRCTGFPVFLRTTSRLPSAPLPSALSRFIVKRQMD